MSLHRAWIVTVLGWLKVYLALSLVVAGVRTLQAV
jgi:hypothetical protein